MNHAEQIKHFVERGDVLGLVKLTFEQAYKMGQIDEREACLAVAAAALPQHEHFDDQRAAGNTARRIMAGIKARG